MESTLAQQMGFKKELKRGLWSVRVFVVQSGGRLSCLDATEVQIKSTDDIKMIGWSLLTRVGLCQQRHFNRT